ncbi:CoA-binding protein [Oligoflexia bacterium]|nr:CoA-binding protein [Oligoflexia bacterium]
MKETVVVLGASPKEDRYSYKAVALLKENGHTVIPVHPKAQTVAEIPVVAQLTSITTAIDTVSVYVNPYLLAQAADDIVKLKPKRVILNPGTESKELEERFTENGIEVCQACTLVLLKTGQF